MVCGRVPLLQVVPACGARQTECFIRHCCIYDVLLICGAAGDRIAADAERPLALHPRMQRVAIGVVREEIRVRVQDAPVPADQQALDRDGLVERIGHKADATVTHVRHGRLNVDLKVLSHRIERVLRFRLRTQQAHAASTRRKRTHE